jgi:methanogenic corrinoid protein MtbC1
MKMTNNENETTLISIGSLAKASGVTVETLRNWERRYGFPEPVRLSSGHRRYPWTLSSRLRLIRRAIEIGYKPSFAVLAAEDELTTVLDEASSHLIENDHTEQSLDGEVAGWLDCVERMEGANLEGQLRRSWSRHGAYVFILDLAVPFLREVGDRWFNQSLSVAHEHFASDVLESFLSSEWRRNSLRASGPRVVLANFEGDFHSLGLHMAAVFLTLSRARVIFLGQNTPLDDIVRASREPEVEAVVIGLSKASDVQASNKHLKELRMRTKSKIHLLVGGNEEVADLEGINRISTLDAFAEWAGALSKVY